MKGFSDPFASDNNSFFNESENDLFDINNAGF